MIASDSNLIHRRKPSLRRASICLLLALAISVCLNLGATGFIHSAATVVNIDLQTGSTDIDTDPSPKLICASLPAIADGNKNTHALQTWLVQPRHPLSRHLIRAPPTLLG